MTDAYYNRAKQEGYRSRAAYKLKQIDETVSLFDGDEAVVDLGAAPGGWLQVAREITDGPVIGVDRQRIDSLEGVTTIRGDLTETSTLEALHEALGPAGTVDIVLSDMAPNVSGEYELDHARSVHLARQALAVAVEVLAPGGDLVVKVFDGSDLQELRDDMETAFHRVRTVRPDATRDESSEVYLVGTGRMTAPVEPGDEVVVEVTDRGSEGDGIAKVDGFTVFVPGAEPGDRLTVRITDVKPRFGFAEPTD